MRSVPSHWHIRVIRGCIRYNLQQRSVVGARVHLTTPHGLALTVTNKHELFSVDTKKVKLQVRVTVLSVNTSEPAGCREQASPRG
jgi:triacylglycerol esterase/lipase EstA (alpha/beta hydrolase family)